jgi:pilus assembly protein Flp/PilA
MLSSFQFVAAWLKAKTESERGASLVEYALLLALIAVVCIIAITTLGTEASKNFTSISNSL